MVATKQTVLFVDDRETHRNYLRTVLAADGYSILEATNSAEALQMARNTRPDLIISDILMPVMDGYALCRACKEDPALQAVPFVFCGATYTDPANEALALKLGAVRTWIGPMEDKAISAAVNELLQANETVHPGSLELPADGNEYYCLHTEVLVRKLEQKILELEQTNRALLSSIEGAAREVTERPEAELALRESERFAQAALDGLASHIAIVDEDGVIVATNQAWRDFAQANPPITTNVCEGASYLAVCDAASGPNADEAHAFAAAMRSVMTGEVMEATVEYACHAPHEQRWFVARITRFTGNGPLRVIVAHENITQRKVAKIALQSKQEEVERYFTNSLDLLCIADLDGYFRRLNPEWEKTLGYPLKELEGARFLDFVHRGFGSDAGGCVTTCRWTGIAAL